MICDGTFDAVPLLTYQRYTIHGLVGDIAPPLLFALLPNKNTLCYDTLLELGKNVCPEISPKLILTDFEKAAINFERTYIGAINPRSKKRRQPQYSLEFWNMRDRSLLGAPQTTNHSEGWHARLNSTCDRNNPNIWQFLDLLKSEMGLVCLDLLSYKIGGERRVRIYVKDSTKKLQNLCLREIPNSKNR